MRSSGTTFPLIFHQADDLSTSVSIDFLTLPLPDGVEVPLPGAAGAASNSTGVDAAGAATAGSEGAPSSGVAVTAPTSAIQMELNSTEDEEDDDDDDDDEDDDVPGAVASGTTAPGANGEREGIEPLSGFLARLLFHSMAVISTKLQSRFLQL